MQVIKYVTANGDTVTWTLKPCNDSDITCQNAQVTLTIPEGVSLTGPLIAENSTVIAVPSGYFDNSADKWYIGDLDANTCASPVSFEFTVDNIELKDIDNRFFVVAEFTSACEEDITADNTNTLVIEVQDDCANINLSISNSDDSSPDSVDLSIS